MERKYYLRGLGLGIAMTAIIMGMAMKDSRAMTNDEIIARAKELGLVENTVLSNTDNAEGLQESEADDRTEGRDAVVQPQDELASDGSVIDTDPEIGDAAAKEDGDGEDVPEADAAGREDIDPAHAGGEDNPESGNVSAEDEQEDTTAQEENSVSEENANGAFTSAAVRVITISNGDSSYTVAKKLADVGIVASAQDFDTFLCQYGYDKRLRTGTFSIPTNASDEQVARIVTGLE